MEHFDPLALLFWKTAGAAVLCGGLVGLERQLRGKAAGVRTSILICFSTALFVDLGATLVGATTDPGRVIGQVVTGVGFLGAGVMMTHDGVVHGVTTAAVIWMLAAIGAMIGLGYFAASFAVSVSTVLILTGIDLLERRLAVMARGVHAKDPDGGSA